MIYIFDIAKLIMSFFVAAIHIKPFSSISTIVNFYIVECIGRMAVPIFFSIAGFFLYKKIFNNQSNYYEIVKKYVLRIFSIYLIWSILYYIPYSDGKISFLLIKSFIIKFLLKGIFSQLWYMQSLIVGVILSTFCSKKIGIKNTLILSFVFFIIGLLIVPYYPYICRTISIPYKIKRLIDSMGYKTGRNGLFFGMFFITMGGYISKYQDLLLKKNVQKYVLMFILSVILLVIESNIIKNLNGQYYGLQLSLVPCSFSAMLLMLIYNAKFNRNINTSNIRSLSFLIYLIHEWISYLYKHTIQKVIIINGVFQNSLIKYIIIMIITIVISELIIYLSKTNKFKMLKKLY